MKILIFGSSGFLPESFINFHIKNNDKLFIVSRNFKGNNSNIESFTINQFIEKIDLLLKIDFDICYFFIADKKIKKKKITLENSILHYLITYIKILKIKKFIYFSSISIYEGLSQNIISSEINISPRSIYAKNKYFEEKLILDNLKSFVSIIFRIPMVVGENMQSRIITYFKIYLKYKLYFLLNNHKCIINYINIENLISNVNKVIISQNNSRIINLSYSTTFQNIYRKKNIISRNNILSYIVTGLIFNLKNLYFCNKIYSFFFNYKKIIISFDKINNKNNNNELINLLK